MQSTQKYNQEHLYLAIKTKLNEKNTAQNTQQACTLLPHARTTIRISKSGKVNTKCHKQQRATTRKNSKGEKTYVKFEQTFKTNQKKAEKKHRTRALHIPLLPNRHRHLVVSSTQHTHHFSFPVASRANHRFLVWNKKTPTPGCVISQWKSCVETVSDFGFNQNDYDWSRICRSVPTRWFGVMDTWYTAGSPTPFGPTP